ncbi:hypothetical protein F5Y14DRAFT_430724 [Nemania sp. NC0429]|nr:hypothetical protein F5Y14DRAFT_430724 [Nemania sp. NC0429]
MHQYRQPLSLSRTPSKLSQIRALLLFSSSLTGLASQFHCVLLSWRAVAAGVLGSGRRFTNVCDHRLTPFLRYSVINLQPSSLHVP